MPLPDRPLPDRPLPDQALPDRPLRVLHLVGSATSDFFADLSRLYARDCLAATADPDRYEPHVAVVGPDRRWRFPVSLDAAALEAAVPTTLAGAVAHLEGLGLDVVVPQMFCLPGMTSYRALFDVLGVPLVGNTAEVMAIGAAKHRARAMVAAAGVDVPAGELLHRGERPSRPLPAVVKPADADNSVGVSLVRADGEWEPALEAAFAHGDAVLVEDYVELGREVRCGIVERDGRLVGLPLEEYRLDAAERPIRRAEDKLRRDDAGELRLVAKDNPDVWILDPADPITERVQEAARRCHTALGCRHYSLFDFRIDPDGRPWFLEAGLYCSFAPTSVLAVMAAAAGTPVTELFARSVAEAIRGHGG